MVGNLIRAAGVTRRTDAEYAGIPVNHALLRKREPHTISRHAQPTSHRDTVFTTVRSKPPATVIPDRSRTRPPIGFDNRQATTNRGEAERRNGRTGNVNSSNAHDRVEASSKIRRKEHGHKQSSRPRVNGQPYREHGQHRADQRDERGKRGEHSKTNAERSRNVRTAQDVGNERDRHRQSNTTLANHTSSGPATRRVHDDESRVHEGARYRDEEGAGRLVGREDSEGPSECDGVAGVPGRPELKTSRSLQRIEDGYLIPNTTIARQLAKVIRAKGTSAPRRKSTRDVATTVGLEGTSVRPAKKQIAEFLRLHFHFKLRHSLTYYTLASQVALIHNIMEGFADDFGWTFTDIRKTLLEMAEDRRKAYRNKRKLNGEWSSELEQRLSVPRGSVSIFRKRPLGDGEVYDWSDSSVERERIRNKKKLKDQMTNVSVPASVMGEQSANSAQSGTQSSRHGMANNGGRQRNNPQSRNADEYPGYGNERNDRALHQRTQEDEDVDYEDDLDMVSLFPRNAALPKHRQQTSGVQNHRPSNVSFALPIVASQAMRNRGHSVNIPTPPHTSR
ncbi:hypothetical protein BJ508DRAFT_330334 [Ascobolus immersus RN42]|uniref:Uncharacterized protein n=1 Tax=Ascobolus immersus RN42 TaxID=1160509 RepID=A0A3N4HTQ8_ASCIM|nr:hypothetical protein BJ508DRAFT_330334 [Ascobolus immersus RN42]